jgi:hypothetical protein
MSQMLGGEGAAGMRFQIALEIQRTLSVRESHARAKSPRAELGSVRAFAGVVVLESLGVVPGEAREKRCASDSLCNTHT